jgi:hypothetical protein
MVIAEFKKSKFHQGERTGWVYYGEHRIIKTLSISCTSTVWLSMAYSIQLLL